MDVRRLALLLAFVTVFPAFASERILLNRFGPSGEELFIARADGTGERRLLSTSGLDYSPSFSADGRWVVFTSERAGSADIYRVHLDGSGLQRLTDDPAYDDQAALSPDGNRLVFVSTRGSRTVDLWILDLQSRKLRNLTNARGGDFRPSWSPDGTWIAFSSDRDTEFKPHSKGWEHVQAASLYVIRPDGSGLRRLTPAGVFAGSPKWSADGKRLVTYEMAVEDTFAARFGPPTAVSQIVSIAVADGARTEHTSGPGLKVSPQFLDADEVGYVVKMGPRPGLAFTSGKIGAAGVIRNPVWSPDGTQVVYQRPVLSPRPQNQRLFSQNPEFELRYSDVFPAFSRDGKLAVTGFDAPVNNTEAPLLTMDADGSNPKQLFHDKEGMAMTASWSPDGAWIAFGFGGFLNQRNTKPARVMMIRADGSGAQDLTREPGNSGFPSVSPDGKRLVYRVWGEPDHGLRILNLEDHSVKILTTDYDNFPSWSPVDDRIAFTRRFGGAFDIFSIRADGTGLTQLTTAPGNDAHSAWSPDGQYILFSSSRLGFKDEAPLYDKSPQPYGELFVMKADGSNQRPLTDNQWEDATPAWRPKPAVK